MFNYIYNTLYAFVARYFWKSLLLVAVNNNDGSDLTFLYRYVHPKKFVDQITALQLTYIPANYNECNILCA